MKKKVGAILLVSALVVSSLFAASSIGGKARLRFGFWGIGSGNLQYGFKDKSDATVKFMIQELIGSSTGEGKIFAEVEAGADLRVKTPNGEDLLSEWTTSAIKYKLYFNKANLVFNKDLNLKLGINGTWSQPRYAQGWEVELDNGNTIESTPFFTYSTAFEGDQGDRRYRAMGAWMPAISLTYDKFAFSFGLDGNNVKGWGNNSATTPGIVALFQGNGIELADGMDLSVAFGYMQSNDMYIITGLDKEGKFIKDSLGLQQHILFGLGYNYTSDIFDISVGANGNAAVNNNPWTYEAAVKGEKNQQYALEASLNLAYKGDVKFNFDAWYLDNQGLWSDGDEPDWVTYHNAADLGYVYRRYDGGWLNPYDVVKEYDTDKAEQGTWANNTLLHQALSARASIQPIDMLGITLRGQDLLNQQILGIDLPINVGSGVTVTPSFEATLDTNKKYDFEKVRWVNGDGSNKNRIYEGMVAVNYAHDLFNLYASLRAGHETLATKNNTATAGGTFYIRPYVSLTSTALIDNCKLELRWQSATFGNAANSPSGKYHTGTGANGKQVNGGEIYVEARINF